MNIITEAVRAALLTLLTGAPLVVSYGGGTNSTAVLILLRDLGLRPVLIMFADTGNEKPGTYEHLEVMQSWCTTNGFPPITVVRNQLPQGIKDVSLYGECLRLGTLPSKTFGHSTCSMKWKVEPQIKYLLAWLKERDISFVKHVIWLPELLALGGTGTGRHSQARTWRHQKQIAAVTTGDRHEAQPH